MTAPRPTSACRVAGYPNLFLLYGPNTNGVTSIIFIHQAQANYVMGALRAMAPAAGRLAATSAGG